MSGINIDIINNVDNSVFSVELDDSLTPSEIINELIIDEFIPSEPNYYLFNKNGTLLELNISLSEQGIQNRETLRVIPKVVGAGGPMDVWVLLSGLAAVSQVLLTIVDMWVRKRKSKVKQEESTNFQTTKVRHVRITMTNGEHINLEKWVDSPEQIKEFIKIFMSEDSAIKPKNVEFVLISGETFNVKISRQSDKKIFERFIELIGLVNKNENSE